MTLNDVFGGQHSEEVAQSLGGRRMRIPGTWDPTALRLQNGLGTLTQWNYFNYPGTFSGNGLNYIPKIMRPSGLIPRSRHELTSGNIASDKFWQ